MKKPSKNLGKNLPCPECKKTLASAIKIPIPIAYLVTTKCKHCDEKIEISIGYKPDITAKKIPVKLKVVVLIIGAIITYQAFTLATLNNAFMAMINEYQINVER